MEPTCPPPEIYENEFGVKVLRPHCWKCATAVAELQGPPVERTSREGVRRRDPWVRQALAEFCLKHCRGTGRSYGWVVTAFSGGSITKERTPDEHKARVDNLYCARNVIARHIAEMTAGKMELQFKNEHTGFNAKGTPTHQRLLLVVPAKEVTPHGPSA